MIPRTTTTTTTFTERLEDVPGRVLLADITASNHPERVYANLREQWGPVAPVDIVPGVPGWLALGYAEVTTVLRNSSHFSRDGSLSRHVTALPVGGEAGALALLADGGGVHQVDGPRHRTLRAPLDEALGAVDDARVARAAGVAAGTLLHGLLARGEADMVRDYAEPVPLLILADLFGLTPDEGGHLADLTAIIRTGSDDAPAAAAQRTALLESVIAARQVEPRDDVATVLATHPNHADVSEAATSLGTAFRMGHDAQTALIAAVLHTMATDRPFHERIRGGRLEIDDAIEEVARLHPPMPHLRPRYALADYELGGRLIAAGDAVVPAVAAANRDPALRTDDPWEDLGARYHLSWGTGVHTSPGLHLARLIARYAVGMVLVSMDRLILTVPAGELGWESTPWSRRPASLPVRFAAGPGI